MSEQSQSPSFSPKPSDVATAIALLTRLPVNADFARGAQAAWAFPLAGLSVALIASAVATIAGWLTLPATVIAALAVATLVITTGAMHEDGLADSADGLWGGFTPARRLEIMRDSHIGTYGVLALILSLSLRIAALSSLAHAGHIVAALIATAALSRAAISVPMARLPHARSDGLAVSTGRPARKSCLLAILIALALTWLLTGFVPMVLAASTCALLTALTAKIATTKIGGQTGDILGANQQVTEIGALLTFAALI